MRILYVTTIEIQLLDIPRTLDAMGYQVYKASLGISAQGFREEDCGRIKDAIASSRAQCVITQDFAESVAQACLETDIPYIAWVYDAPQKELYTPQALYPCNYIFVFDRQQMKRLKDIGIRQVYHIPLAVLPEKVELTLGAGPRNYINEITFVGQLYQIQHTVDLINQADPAVKAELEANMDSCFMRWDSDTHMHGILGKRCIEYFAEIDHHMTLINYPYITEQFYYEAAVLSRLLANRERVAVLNTLAEDYDVKFYTKDKDTSQLSDKVHVMPGVKYDTEISRLYYDSKININITLHCIETGASQRIFDVMAAGGFMLSNYQEELAEMFIPGEEIVLYHDMEELRELTAYYLSHDREREEIAARGRQKVLENYNYRDKLQEIMQIVQNRERTRRETYITLQGNELAAQAESLLGKKDEDAYHELCRLFARREYNTAIQGTDSLRILCEMLGCWQRELKVGKACVLDDVDSPSQAMRKYQNLWQGIQCIAGQDGGRGREEAVRDIRSGSVSRLFLAWLVYSGPGDREQTFGALSDCLKEYNPVESLELLSYGLLFMPDSDGLLMQKASLLMELNQWQTALRTLRQIAAPTDGIQEIMAELEDALGEVCP